MTPQEMLPYVSLVLGLIALLGHAKGYFSSGEKTLIAQVDANEKKLVEHDRRIQAIEGELKHLPDRETAHKLELALANISGRLDTLDERLKPIAATSGRLQEFLLEQAQK
ncbi:Protein of unknown function [Rhizobium sp. RU35A]|uniref:DUF2730 family protein n=1 Tax=Rhizobium sp. RU35A TaxID=1907414 RepID=UPI000955FF31|nr:DUF2730 family protein [Rhizobium sp. RU35A]SIP88823.1 Protein of unknown function [Rhizobium sp. RU35A]